MNPVATINNQAEIFTRAIECHADELTSDVARFIVSLELAPDDESRMNELAEKARKGKLSDAEEVELNEYRRCGRLVEILKLKARMVLQRPG